MHGIARMPRYICFSTALVYIMADTVQMHHLCLNSVLFVCPLAIANKARIRYPRLRFDYVVSCAKDPISGHTSLSADVP